jgi:DNA-binding response OmpR family regulator
VRILVVEDDDGVAAALHTALVRRGVRVRRVARGSDVLAFVNSADAVLLDLGLPDADGLDVCRQMRQACAVPIVMATARGHVRDRIRGLEAGADDYLVKPYDVGELLARLHAVLRRRPSQHDRTTTPPASGVPLEIESDRGFVTLEGREVSLSPKEIQLLTVIAEAAGTVCTRKRLVARVWGRWWSGADRNLDTHIAGLRTKLGRPELIQTVRGVGFRLASPAEHSGTTARCGDG